MAGFTISGKVNQAALNKLIQEISHSDGRGGANIEIIVGRQRKVRATSGLNLNVENGENDERTVNRLHPAARSWKAARKLAKKHNLRIRDARTIIAKAKKEGKKPEECIG